MNCPKCFEPLRISDRQGIEIDYCPECRGVWLDRGELDKIIERTSMMESREAPPERRHDEKYRSSDNYKGGKKYSDDRYYQDKKKYYKKKKAKNLLEELFDVFD